jgi:hypothetical protein
MIMTENRKVRAKRRLPPYIELFIMLFVFIEPSELKAIYQTMRSIRLFYGDPAAGNAFKPCMNQPPSFKIPVRLIAVKPIAVKPVSC